MSTSTTAASSSQRFAPWQMAPLVVTLIVSTGLVFYLAGSHWAYGVSQASRGGAAVASKDPSSSGIGQQLPWIVLALVVLGAAAPTPWRAGFGARAAWPGPRRGMRTTRGAVVYALLLTLVGSIAAAVTDATGTAVHSVGEVYASFDWTARILSSLRAALWEETVDVAIPVGLAFVITRAVEHLRRRPRAASDVRLVPWWCYLAGMFGLVTRFTDHLYQGPVAASFVVLVGVGALLVFARYGSILPLIVGHFIYDVIVAGAPAGVLVPVAVMVGIGAATFAPTVIDRRLGM